MATERPEAAAASTAAAAAAATAAAVDLRISATSRPPFMSQPLSARRAEVESWSASDVSDFWVLLAPRVRAEGMVGSGMDGAALWASQPPHRPDSRLHLNIWGSRFSVDQVMRLMRDECAEEEAESAQADVCRREIHSAVLRVRHGQIHRAEMILSFQPAARVSSNAGLYAGCEAAAPKRGAGAVAEEPSAKRARAAGPNGADGRMEVTDTISPDDQSHPDHSSARQPGSSDHSAAAAAAAASGAAASEASSGGSAGASSAGAAASSSAAALFRELPWSSTNSGSVPRAVPLRVDSLPQEWFVGEVPRELVCCVCMDVARDPPNLEACGHAVCRDCLTQVRRRSSLCPVCRASFANSKLAPQPFAQSMVWQLRVRCVQHDKGCGWQGQLGVEARNLKEHDAVCTFKEVVCPLCAQLCSAQEAPEHKHTCPARMVECASCERYLPFGAMAQHQPAIRATAAVDLDDDDDEKESGQASAAASAASAAPAADADAHAADLPAAASSSSTAAASAAASSGSQPSPLLPPFTPPCVSSEACPRGCEDPQHPGHVLAYLRPQRSLHERTCAERPVSCSLCEPAHPLPPRQLSAHVAAVLDDAHRRAFAAQRVSQLLIQQSAPPAPGGASSEASSSFSRGQVPSHLVPPPLAGFGLSLGVGDLCDCLDLSDRHWRLAEVRDRSATRIFIHYVDWKDKWDEWIPAGDARVQPPRTRTEGYTGPRSRRDGDLASPRRRMGSADPRGAFARSPHASSAEHFAYVAARAAAASAAAAADGLPALQRRSLGAEMDQALPVDLRARMSASISHLLGSPDVGSSISMSRVRQTLASEFGADVVQRHRAAIRQTTIQLANGSGHVLLPGLIQMPSAELPW